jgi:solute carrier family 25 carnitine/acylcarnitine transporter 20/29
MTGVTPIFALSFAGNAAGCNMIRSITGHEKLSYGELFCGGMLAGVYSTVIMAPGERIKCLLQTQPGKYKGMGDCAKARFQFDLTIYFFFCNNITWTQH